MPTAQLSKSLSERLGTAARGARQILYGAEHGYEPSKLKLPGFVTLGIKMATAEVSTPHNETFAKVVTAPGYSEHVFPLPRLVDEDGVVDPITDCSNADKTIRRRRACSLRIEDMASFFSLLL